MSDIAIREALIGGDLDTWGTYEQEHNHLAIGVHTRKLYLSGATLYLSKGKTGIYDGTQYYVISNSAARSLSLAGLTVTCWAKVELSVVAGVVTTTLTSIAGQTDPNVVPTAFTGAFDETKGGYYIASTKRCIGVIWITAAGACDGIVNVYGNNDNYQGYAVNNLFTQISGKREWQIELTTGASLGTYIPPTIVGNVGLKITLGKYDSGAGEACFDPSSLAENCIYLGNTITKMYDGLQGQHTTFEARSDGWHLIRGIVQPVAGEPDLGGGWHERTVPGDNNWLYTNTAPSAGSWSDVDFSPYLALGVRQIYIVIDVETAGGFVYWSKTGSDVVNLPTMVAVFGAGSAQKIMVPLSSARKGYVSVSFGTMDIYIAKTMQYLLGPV